MTMDDEDKLAKWPEESLTMTSDWRDHLPTLPHLDFIKSAAPVEVHPNGFIMFQVNDIQRLHLWEPALEQRQKVRTPIHNHRFGFRSVVLAGRLVNIVYQPQPFYQGRGPAYRFWRCVSTGGNETVLERASSLNTRFWMNPVRREVIQEAETYTIEAGEFHETLVNEPALTLITKIGKDPLITPEVAVQAGTAPDNSHSRQPMKVDMDFVHWRLEQLWPWAE